MGFSDFWRRWHISLSTFLRDFLYIPLGGNRSGPIRAGINLMIVMFLGGLWHGAAWTFVVWGLIHGLCLVLERVLRAIFEDAAWTETLGVQILLGLATYAAVCFAWVFFRAGDFTTAARLVRAMIGWYPNGDAILGTREILQVAGVTLALLVAHWSLRNITIEHAVARTAALARDGGLGLDALRHHPHPRKRQCLHLLPILSGAFRILNSQPSHSNGDALFRL